MVQTRLNSGLIEDLVLEGDNGSAENSSCGTILKALQKPAGGNVLPVGKGVQLPSGQQAFENPGAMGAKNPMEVDTLSGNKKSARKDEIAAEIERLKKEQKKA